jgi:hypothetical protein
MSEAVKIRLKQKAVEKQIDLAGVNLKEDEKALFEEMEVKTLAEKSNLRTLVQQMQTETANATNKTTASTTATASATTAANSTSTSTKKRGKVTKKGRKGVPTITKTKPKTSSSRSSDGAGTADTTSASTSTIASGLRKAKKGRKGVQCRNLSNEQRASLLQSLLKHKMSSNKSNGSSMKSTSSTTTTSTSTTTTINSNNKSNSNSNSNNSSILHHKLRKGALLEASRAFGVSTKTCKRIWERFLETSDGDVSHRKHQSGRPKKISSVELLTKIASLPKETRSSVRGLARALGMPHTTIHRRLKSGEIQLEGLSEAYSGKKKSGKCATPTASINGNEDVVENEKEKGILLGATTVGNH